VTRAFGANPRFGQPAFVGLRGAGGLFSRFYELGVERHRRAQRATDPATARRTGETVAGGQLVLCGAADVGAATGQPAVRIGDRTRGDGRARSCVIGDSDAQQLGLRRGPPAADAAAQGCTAPRAGMQGYVACSPAAASLACCSITTGATSASPSLSEARSPTLSLAMAASAW
jgi:hypothetical protein